MFDVEKSIREKQEFQEEFSSQIELNSNLILEACTGAGKTRAALLAIEKAKSNKKWLVLVPEIQLIKNFWDDFDKHKIDIKDKIEDVICYASLKKFEGTDLNILMDEGHHSTSDIRMEYLKTINSDFRIVLSATLNQEIKEKLYSLCNWKEIKLSMVEAIERGILPEPKIIVKYIELDNRRIEYLFKYGKKEVKLTAEKYYKKISDNIKYWQDKWEEEGKPWQYNKFLLAATQRKRWLSNYKTEEAKNIIKDIENQRFICFCGSVEQAHILGGKKAVHSKNSKTENTSIIEEFNSEVSSNIFACGMLREGANLSACPNVIIIQVDSDIKSAIQMTGRSMRHTSPVIHILCIKGTQDEKYLNTFLKTINPDWVTKIYK